MFVYDRDVRVEGLGLWLDARRKKDFSFVSHAHADHAARHESILATPVTLALAAERRRMRSERMKRPPRTQPREVPVEFGRPRQINGATVTLLPAGHILGSAQILVERAGRRLLYSGDFCPQKTAAAEDIEVPKAHTLIMECTYGLPEHRFPPREETVGKICAFVDRALAGGAVPVLVCYALGKAQEVLRLLTRRGYAVAVEREAFRLAGVYESFGVSFGKHRLLDSHAQPGEVVIAPNLKAVSRHLEGMPVRSAAITGWAVGSFSHRARRADTTIPLSDHADFDGLLEYARAVEPEIVYILHGPGEFAYYLARAGFEVGSLREKQPVKPSG